MACPHQQADGRAGRGAGRGGAANAAKAASAGGPSYPLLGQPAAVPPPPFALGAPGMGGGERGNGYAQAGSPAVGMMPMMGFMGMESGSALLYPFAPGSSAGPAPLELGQRG